MDTEIINGQDLKIMLESGLANLADRYKEVDALNVFPVPDGDTGTNMYLTMTAAVEEAARAEDLSSIGMVAEAASRGALMGARGNSGVILSQLLRGFARGLKNTDRVSGPIFAMALDEGVKVAFKAIIKPVEGTILTVSREAAKAALKTAAKNNALDEILRATCQAAEETLNHTPDMLPALKEAGVVDAGGMGWLIILQGFESALVEDYRPTPIKTTESDQGIQKPPSQPVKDSQPGVQELEFPYCTEVLIKVKAAGTTGFRETLESMGDSLMLVDSGDFTRMHVHSAHPGKVLEECLKYGFLTDVKITNMNEQSAAKNNSGRETRAPVKTGTKGKPFGIVAVATGEGIKKVMDSLGADIVIAGGQTMNPSTQELLAAVEGIESDTIVILPNNGNIILTAAQIASLTQKKVHVIPCKTVPQGLAALIAVNPEADIDKNINAMKKSFNGVKTGEVTFAVRDTRINGNTIASGSVIGLYDDEIVTFGTDIPDTVCDLLTNMISGGDEICTLYYGQDVSETAAKTLNDRLIQKFPDIEFELLYGGQPLYYYIISLE